MQQSPSRDTCFYDPPGDTENEAADNLPHSLVLSQVLRGKFKRAGWDDAFLTRLLTIF